VVGFREILSRLNDHGVDYVVIGGVAAALLGSPMGTLDVDVCTTFDEVNLAKLIAALRDLNPKLRMRPDKMRLPLEIERLKGVRNLYLITDLGILDLLGEVPGVGRLHDLRERTEVVHLAGFSCRTLDLDTLIKSKAFAGRPKDIENIKHLEAVRQLRRKQPGLFDEPGRD
jgi:predicted nucleotidyltransferase